MAARRVPAYPGRMTPHDTAKREALPVYERIQAFLRQGIASGEFRPGDRLPSGNELAARFETTRATVAHALRELAFERLILREVGRGTFVAHPPIKAPFEPTLSESFEDAIREAHGRIEYRVLGVGPVAASEEIATRLGLATGTEILKLERLRLVGDLPLSLVTRYLPLEIGRRISADAIGRYSIHQIMAEEIGRPIIHTEGHVRAEVADQRVAGLLAIRKGSPILTRVYSMSDAAGKPMVYGVSLFRQEFQVAYNSDIG